MLKVVKAPGSDVLREAETHTQAAAAAGEPRSPLAREGSPAQVSEPPVHTARVKHGVAVFARTVRATWALFLAVGTLKALCLCPRPDLLLLLPLSAPGGPC